MCAVYTVGVTVLIVGYISVIPGIRVCAVVGVAVCVTVGVVVAVDIYCTAGVVYALLATALTLHPLSWLLLAI